VAERIITRLNNYLPTFSIEGKPRPSPALYLLFDFSFWADRHADPFLWQSKVLHPNYPRTYLSSNAVQTEGSIKILPCLMNSRICSLKRIIVSSKKICRLLKKNVVVIQVFKVLNAGWSVGGLDTPAFR
jgi:hypothetical protein